MFWNSASTIDSRHREIVARGKLVEQLALHVRARQAVELLALLVADETAATGRGSGVRAPWRNPRRPWSRREVLTALTVDREDRGLALDQSSDRIIGRER